MTDFNTGTKVEVKALDLVVKQLGIAPNVIKIDTEGYEIKVLEGAKYALEHYKPKVLVASYHYPNELTEIVDFLSAIGFRCHVYRIPLTLQRASETYVYAEPCQQNLCV